MAKQKEMLIVGSKVKAAIKANTCMCAGDTLPALNEKVHELLADAVARCKANKRSTVRPADL